MLVSSFCMLADTGPSHQHGTAGMAADSGTSSRQHVPALTLQLVSMHRP